MIEISSEYENRGPKILVLGVGGGGNNAVGRMIETGIKGVSFGVINTDMQVLQSSKAESVLQIGKKVTDGYGAGSDPEIGEAAANESSEELEDMVRGNDLVIITAGMGGGTGTGAAPVIARICKECGILTVAVVTTPFTFESLPRVNAALSGVEKLKEVVDTLLVIPNDKLLYLSDKALEVEDAFLAADSVLKYTIEGITNIVYNRGIVNLDFNDLRATLKNKGLGHLGIGTVNADESVLEAVKMAINSPLLDTNIAGATNLLVNSSGRVSIVALNEAISYIREIAGENVNIIWGNVKADDFDYEKIVVTIIATGMPEQDITMPQVNKVRAKTGNSNLINTQVVNSQFNDTQPSNSGFNPNYRPGTTMNQGDREYLKPRVNNIEIVIPDFLKNRG